jgi:hypothetical protein
MPCLKTINLSKNGITDDLDREVLEMFDHPSITNIDLSNNNMKKLGTLIGKKLKEGHCTHMKWLDLTQNDFSLIDTNATGLILAGLKRQNGLMYAGLSAKGAQCDQLVRLI